MQFVSSVLVIFLKVCLIQAESLLPAAVKYAVSSSFNGTVNDLNIAVETDIQENKQIFLDVIDDILLEVWTFRFQINVNNENGQLSSDFNLWFIDSFQSFRRLLPWIHDCHRDSQLFLFIVLRTSEDATYEIQKIFSDLIMIMVANVNVILEDDSGEVLFYTFYPYQELACRSTEPMTIYRFSESSPKLKGSFFPPKIENFHRCPFRIRTRNEVLLNIGGYNLPKALSNYDMSTLEVIMLEVFESKINFTWEISNFPNPDSFTLEEAGLLPTIAEEPPINGPIDVVLSFFRIGPNENNFFSKSVPYCLTWVVITIYARQNELRMLTWIVEPFTLSSWICIIGCFALITVCVIMAREIRRLVRIFHMKSRLRGGLIEVIAVAVGVPFMHLPRSNFLRFNLIVLLLGTFIIRTAYQGKLFDAFRGRAILNTPHTIKELFEENYTLLAHMHYRSVINELNEVEYQNFQALEYFEKSFHFHEGDKDVALVATYIHIYTFYTYAERRSLMIDIVFGEQVCMFFHQHSAIQPKINHILLQMEEVGIMHYFRKNFEDLKNSKFSTDASGQEPEALGIERFAFVFYLTFVLYGISCLIFAIELFWVKIIFGLKRMRNVLVNCENNN